MAAFLAAYFVVINIRQAAKSLMAQRVSNDVQTMLLIWERLDQHWTRYRKSNSEEDKTFEGGQLLSYYEISCNLFRKKVFSTETTQIFGEHLRDTLSQMQDDPEFKKLFDELQSHDGTFESIRWFLKKIAKT